MNRRDLLAACLLGASAMALPRPARAAWTSGFDTGSATMATRFTDDPLLGQATLEATRRGAEAYDALAARGGWPAVHWAGKMSLGTRHPQVIDLRSRLALTNDLDRTRATGDVFDSHVDAAVRRFQARHGLGVDGVGGASTLAALNVPAAERAAQLSDNIPRIAQAQATERRFVTVNVPSAEIELVEAGKVVARHTAIVGQPDRKTPLLTSAIYEVNFNPYWTVPASILRKDLLPTIRKNPDYLEKMQMRIFDRSWKEISPSSIDWSGNEAESYIFRQDPGAKNALGRARINFANDFQVYLHDTPQPGLFGDPSRFNSSGCVRIQRIPEFIAWLLKDTAGWDLPRVAQALRSGERKDVRIAAPIPVHFVYITAWSARDLTSNFREDIYQILERTRASKA